MSTAAVPVAPDTLEDLRAAQGPLRPVATWPRVETRPGGGNIECAELLELPENA